MDVERGSFEEHNEAGAEHESLLPTSNKPESPEDVQKPLNKSTFLFRNKFSLVHLVSAFLAGLIGCAIAQYAFCGPSCFGIKETSSSDKGGYSGLDALADPTAGSTEIHPFPPPSPTNVDPSLFPTDVGYAGGTPTGAEPAIIATAPEYPIHTGAAQLVKPASLGGAKNGNKKDKDWDLFKQWGNLSPWYSNERGTFGLDSDPGTPDTCRVTGLHFLHRHGARYPTAWGEGCFAFPPLLITHKQCYSVVRWAGKLCWEIE